MWFLLGVAFAATGDSGVEPDLEEAASLADRGHHGASLDLLRRAARHPEGRIDPRVWLAMADGCVALGDHACASDAGEQALTWSRTDEQAERATALVTWLDDGFGTVTLRGSAPGLVAQVDLAAKAPLEEDEQAWVDVVSERLSAGVVLPVTVALPEGVAYSVDGQQVHAGRGEVVEIEALRPSLQGTEIQVSTGFQQWMAWWAQGAPWPMLELGVVVPAGRALLGARAGAIVPLGDTGVVPSLTLEAGLGGRPDDALRVREGVSVRGSTLPWVRAGESMQVLAISPGLWASVGAFDRTGSRGFSMGLRGVVEPTLLASDGLEFGGWNARVVVDLGWER